MGNDKKIQWIDWMKVLAMYFVVWGHCFPQKMSAFVYAFNVPVFFVLSGLLSRERENSSDFYPKLWRTLVVPYLLLAFIKGAGAIIKGWASGDWLLTVGGILGGFHTIDGVQGCSNLWFVYTLIVLRLVHHWVGGDRRWLIGLSCIFMLTSVVLNAYCTLPKWGVSNALLAMPFFTIGQCLRPYLKTLGNSAAPMRRLLQANALWATGIVLVLALAVYGVGALNGAVDMYAGDYGQNVLLLLLGGVLGSFMVFYICYRWDSYRPKFVGWLAAGNLVILTFHRELLHEPLKLIRKSGMDAWMQDASSALASVVVMMCFIPICWLIVRYVPLLVGGRKA